MADGVDGDEGVGKPFAQAGGQVSFHLSTLYERTGVIITTNPAIR